uniref:Coronin n=1 Tax=Macrostomum lignano TaxID=282301 RepID=A0A1I8ITM7_9PLAT
RVTTISVPSRWNLRHSSASASRACGFSPNSRATFELGSATIVWQLGGVQHAQSTVAAAAAADAIDAASGRASSLAGAGQRQGCRRGGEHGALQAVQEPVLIGTRGAGRRRLLLRVIAGQGGDGRLGLQLAAPAVGAAAAGQSHRIDMETTDTASAATSKPAGIFRHSKFRHVYGKAAKRDRCYDNIRVTTNSGDAQTALCAVNPLYLAIITDAVGGGSFLVLPLDRFGRVDRDPPLVAGHRAPVLDIQWCPHNDHCIASASEDCTAKLWLIGPDLFDGGRPLTQCHRELAGHNRRVSLLVWHPTASMVLLTAGADNRVLIWNADRQLVMREIAFPDAVLSCSFSWTGAIRLRLSRPSGSALTPALADVSLSLSQSACIQYYSLPLYKELAYLMTHLMKQRPIPIYQSFGYKNALHLTAPLQECRMHSGGKPVQVVCLRDGRVFSTGFADSSGGRQLALWDGDSLASIDRRNLDDFGSSGVLLPLYDPDVGLLYLAGRGDCAVRYYELTDESPHLHYLGVYRGAEPLRGVGAMPKRGLEVGACEIGRLYLVGQRGLCQPISFTVPRRCEQFQPDLYPDTRAPASAIGAEDWLAGAEEQPLLMPVTPNNHQLVLQQQWKQNSLNATYSSNKAAAPIATYLSSSSRRSSPPLARLSDRVDRLADTVRLLAAEGADLRSRVARLEAAAAAAAAGNQHNADDKMVEDDEKDGSFEAARTGSGAGGVASIVQQRHSPVKSSKQLMSSCAVCSLPNESAQLVMPSHLALVGIGHQIEQDPGRRVHGLVTRIQQSN